jgi:hypothetical protein
MYEWYLAEMREMRASDLAERLRDLASLKQEGLINGREFARMRKQVLSQIGNAEQSGGGDAVDRAPHP